MQDLTYSPSQKEKMYSWGLLLIESPVSLCVVELAAQAQSKLSEIYSLHPEALPLTLHICLHALWS